MLKYNFQENFEQKNYNSIDISDLQYPYIKHWKSNICTNWNTIIQKINNKKTILFITHELSLTGAPIILLDLLVPLQKVYNIIQISGKNGDLLKKYVFLNKPIIIESCRKITHTESINDIYKFKYILNQLNPDLVFLNTIVNYS